MFLQASVAKFVQPRPIRTAEGQCYHAGMAKPTIQNSLFLIFPRNDERQKLTEELKADGYIVHDYMTAREFLIDKPNHSSGVVVADYRLQGMTAVELCLQLANEQAEYPTVFVAGHATAGSVLAAGLVEFVGRPMEMEALKTAIIRAKDGEVFTHKELERAFR